MLPAVPSSLWATQLITVLENQTTIEDIMTKKNDFQEISDRIDRKFWTVFAVNIGILGVLCVAVFQVITGDVKEAVINRIHDKAYQIIVSEYIENSVLKTGNNQISRINEIADAKIEEINKTSDISNEDIVNLVKKSKAEFINFSKTETKKILDQTKERQRGQNTRNEALSSGHLKVSTLENLIDYTIISVPQKDDFKNEEFLHYWLIEFSLYSKDFDSVERLSEKYFQHFGNGDHYYQVFYSLSTALFLQNKALTHTYLITHDFFSSLTKRDSQNLRKYLVFDSIKKREYVSAISFLFNEHGQIVYEEGDLLLSDIINKIDSVNDIDDILESFQNNKISILAEMRKKQIIRKHN